MATCVSIPDNSNRELRHLLIACCILVGLLVSYVLILDAIYDSVWIFLAICSAPAFACLTTLQLVRVARMSTASVHFRAAFFGLFFILGAGAVDILCTLIVSPNLDMEGNLYVRKLLDSGVSLFAVGVFFAVFQFSFLLLFSVVWIAFLKHLPLLLDSIRDSQPKSKWEFLKSATGGAHLTWRQWLLPFKPSEVPLMYHSFWIAAISLVFGLSLFRWYAAGEWLGLFEISDTARHAVILTGVFGTLVVYLVSLAVLSRKPFKHAA